METATAHANLTIGVVGTGMMGKAHATLWTRLGIKVVIGSRDAARGRAVAEEIGCAGGDHLQMLRASQLVIVCAHPGPTTIGFYEKYRDEIVGKEKMFVDISVAYGRFVFWQTDGETAWWAQCLPLPPLQAPPPYFSQVPQIRDLLNDPSAS